jgi:LysR family transcriptional regulator, glycine cleavage system transcriptional activator
MSRPLPLSAPRAFEAPARTGSFRAAADDLGLTPSSVSHAIRGLEQTLGAALFLRTGPTIRLTEAGRTLVHHVERGFGELLLGIGSVSAHKPQLLRVRSAPSFAAQWLLPRLRRLLREVEGLELRIAASTDYARFAAEDEFDVDIVYGMPSPDTYGHATHQNLTVPPLGTEVITPLCAPALAASIRAPRDQLRQTLIESETKRVGWSACSRPTGSSRPNPASPASTAASSRSARPRTSWAWRWSRRASRSASWRRGGSSGR